MLGALSEEQGVSDLHMWVKLRQDLWVMCFSGSGTPGDMLGTSGKRGSRSEAARYAGWEGAAYRYREGFSGGILRFPSSSKRVGGTSCSVPDGSSWVKVVLRSCCLS